MPPYTNYLLPDWKSTHNDREKSLIQTRQGDQMPVLPTLLSRLLWELGLLKVPQATHSLQLKLDHLPDIEICGFLWHLKKPNSLII